MCSRQNDVPLHDVRSGTISEKDGWCTSRTFLIRYCEEKVQMGELCLLRLETLDLDVDVVCEYVLEFGDLTSHGGSDNFEVETYSPAGVAFDRIALHTFRLHLIEGGIYTLTPVVFDEFHVCVANICVYASLVDYRLRIHALGSPQFEWNDMPSDAEDKKARNIADIASSHTDPRSFADFLETWRSKLTAHDEGQLTVMSDRVAEKKLTSIARQSLIKSLATAHQRLYKFIEEACGEEAGPVFDTMTFKYPVDIDDDTQDKRRIASALSEVAAQTTALWTCFVMFVEMQPHAVFQHLSRKYAKRCASRWTSLIYRDSIHVEQATTLHSLHNPNIAKTHMQLAAKHRTMPLNREPQEVVDQVVFNPALEKYLPIVFEQRYRRDRDAPTVPQRSAESYVGTHAFVLVHGYQGNSFDMRLLRNNISLLYPSALVMCSTANEDHTSGDIACMGARLAKEVVDAVRCWVGKGWRSGGLTRLSFIGHSIGGLIIRAALPFLEQFAPYFHAFITLGTMHLGYMYNTNKLVDVGIWAIHKWSKCLCLKQLQMLDTSPKRKSVEEFNIPKDTVEEEDLEPDTESPPAGRDSLSARSDRISNDNTKTEANLENTTLYKLSTRAELALFRHIVLLSSGLDQYAPYESARIERSERAQNDEWGDVYEKMINNLLRGVDPERLLRLDVNFLSPDQSLDTIIGRWAHMQFLENQSLMQLLLHSYAYIFC